MESGNISTRTVTVSTSATSTAMVSTSTTTGMTTATTTSACRLPGSQTLSKETPVMRGSFCYRSLVDLIQPPSILPISSRFASMTTYFFASIALTSFMRRTQMRRKFSRTLVFSSVGSFSDLLCWLANKMPSKTSMSRLSHFCQSEIGRAHV